STSTSEYHCFARGFQKIVGDFERAVLSICVAATDCVSVGASAKVLDTVKVAEVGVDDGGGTDAIEADPELRFISLRSMQPGAVNNDVIRRLMDLYRDQSGRAPGSHNPRDFETNESIMIGSLAKDDGPRITSVVDDRRQYVLRIVACVLR